MDTKEFRRQIAEKFIDSLKENPEHWQRQWSVSGGRPEIVYHTQSIAELTGSTLHLLQSRRAAMI